jgi:chromosome segregation ATPase
MVRTDLSDAALRLRQGRDAFEAKLFNEMKAFAELLSKSATEVVIEALRQVILDFNKNLTEQFGENFKMLDSSVKQLVQWQVQYGHQLDEMGQQFERSVDAIETTRTAIHEIGERCASIPGVMETLREVLEVNQHQLKQLQDHLGAFAQLRDRAIEAVPEVQRVVVGVAEQLSTAAVEMSSVLEAKSGIYAAHLDRTNAAAREMATHVTRASEQLQGDLSHSVHGFESASREMMSRLELASRSMQEQLNLCTQEMATAVQRDTGRTLGGVEQQVQAAVERTGEAVNVQLNALDRAVEQELSRVFTRFGQALVRISDAFTGDYEKLTRRLAEMSRSVA